MGWGPISATKSQGEFPKAPPGNHLAILIGLFDMGEQWQDGYKGAPGKFAHRALFVWELVAEKIAGTNKPHVIAIDLTLSLNEKAKLRKWVEARTGKAIPDGGSYDPLSELGQPCLLNVVLNGDYPKVEGMAAVPKGMAVPAPFYKVKSVSLDEFKAGAKIPEWCPWLYGSPLEDHIKACRELGGTKPKPNGAAKAPAADSAPPSDDAPPPDGAPEPAADSKWDYYDGSKWLLNQNTAAVAVYMVSTGTEAGKLWVRPHGATDKAQAKRASEYGFTGKTEIPW